MRVLSIRGRNLNSLPSFSIDFDKAPLGDAGIVAVTGPTGAGKSTLLDAITLALYGRTPRLKSGERVGQVITRGSREALAEVEIATGGRRLRARWSRRLARSGTLQPAHMELIDTATDTGIASGLTGVREAIGEILGLSFDEFRQAVLLAQGQFTAFLAAGPSERAALLERLTGASIYRRLSQAAYARALALDGRVRVAEAELRALSSLSPEEVSELHKQRRAARTEVKRLAATLDDTRRQVAWFDKLADLEADLQRARVQLEAAEVAHRQSEPRREAMRVADLAQALRPSLERHSRLVQGNQELALQEETARTAAAGFTTLVDKGRGSLAEARATAVRRRQERTAAMSGLTRARQLDGSLVAAESAKEASAALAANAAHTRRSRDQEVDEGTAALTAAEQEARDHGDWLARHAHATVLADSAEHIRDRIGQWREAIDTARRIAAERTSATADQESAAAALRQATADHDRATQRSGDATRRLAAEREALAALLGGRSVEAAQQELQDAHSAQARVAEAQRALTASERAQEAVNEAATAQRAADAESTGAQEAVHRTDAALAQATDDRATAEEAARLSHRNNLAGTLRDALVPGESCLVCGSTEHPHAHEPAPVDDRAAGTDLEEAQRREREARDAQVAAAERCRAATRRSEEAALAHTAATFRLRAAASAAGVACAAVSGAPDSRTALEAVATRMTSRIEALTQAVTGARARMMGVQAIERELAAYQGSVAQLDAARAAAKATADARADAVRRAEGRLAAAQARVRLLEAELGARVAALPEAAALVAEQDPTGLLARVDAVLTELRSRTTARDQATQRQQACIQALTRAREASERALVAAQAADAEAARHQLEHTTLLAQRRTLFDGRNVDEVQEELDQAVTETDAEVQKLASRLEQLQAESAGATDRIASLAARHAALAAEEGELRTVLEERAAAAGLGDIEGARAALREESWLGETRREIGLVAGRLREGQAGVAAAEARLGEHRRDDAPALTTADVVVEQLRRLEESRDALLRELGTIDSALAAHKKAGARQKALGHALDEVRAEAAISTTLRELIGQASGDRFQRYAQGLTLQRLLGLANDHLQTLRPRYALQRNAAVGDLDVEVIDRHMGDQRRPIDTLSGGESFLLSLALALGLSDLARAGTSIDSLFLDEGFGSLDPDSLDQAMSALDALQATGRQIVVVSHVELLKERVAARVDVEPRGGGLSRVRVVESG